jgi:hypothetical protein
VETGDFAVESRVFTMAIREIAVATRVLGCGDPSRSSVQRSERMDMFNEILWGRFSDVHRLFSLPRSTTYCLINDGVIKSKLVRRKGQRGCGIRLIDMRSVQKFIENSPEKPTKRTSDRMRETALMKPEKTAAQRDRKDGAA